MSDLNNVNFQLLLKQHNGDMGRAKQAWEHICNLGKFGNVPPTYEGGLDVKGLRIANEETKAGTYRRTNPLFHNDPSQPQYLTTAPISEDDIHRIEDIAAGDRPN